MSETHLASLTKTMSKPVTLSDEIFEIIASEWGERG